MPKLPVIALFLCLAACRPEPQAWHGTDVSGHLPDLAFELVDSRGMPVTERAFHGRTTALFFGFTSCPGPCPSTLARLGVALEQMADAAAEVQVLLVTVDPARDTPAALFEYTQTFGPWLHGLTGPAEELQRLRAAYHVSAQMLPPDAQGAYDISHNLAVLVFDAQGRCRLLISDTSDPAAVAADLMRLAGESA